MKWINWKPRLLSNWMGTEQGTVDMTMWLKSEERCTAYQLSIHWINWTFPLSPSNLTDLFNHCWTTTGETDLSLLLFSITGHCCSVPLSVPCCSHQVSPARALSNNDNFTSTKCTETDSHRWNRGPVLQSLRWRLFCLWVGVSGEEHAADNCTKSMFNWTCCAWQNVINGLQRILLNHSLEHLPFWPCPLTMPDWLGVTRSR